MAGQAGPRLIASQLPTPYKAFRACKLMDLVMLNFAAARRNMVDSQLKPNQVSAIKLIEAMGKVPRELFVPETLQDLAYMDEDLPIGGNRYLMEPRVFARLVQAAEIGSGDIVLDVGCGAGYSTAILAQLAATVVGIEEDRTLRARASDTLIRLGVDNAAVIEASHSVGDPDHGPFDVIILGGAVEIPPDGLLQQLADGGRLVAVEFENGVGRGILIAHNGGLFAKRQLFDASVPVLAGFGAKQGFAF